MKQVFRPKYDLLIKELHSNRVDYPKAIILSKENYKKLCKELKHKVKTVLGVSIVNYYYEQK